MPTISISFREVENSKDIRNEMNRIEKISELLQANPTDCFLWHALGLEKMKLDLVNEAIDAFQQVLSIDSNYVGTYYHLARALIVHGQTKEGINLYKKGIEVATGLKDMHAKNELQMALDDLLDE